MFPSPLSFRFIEDDHEYVKMGDGSLKIDTITSLYFHRGRRLSQKLHLKNFRPLGRVDVSEPAFFSLERRPYTWKWGGGDWISQTREYIFTWVVVCPPSTTQNVLPPLVNIHTLKYFELQTAFQNAIDNSIVNCKLQTAF